MKFSDIIFRLMQCREAQEAASREMDGQLGWLSRILLRWHCRSCWCCQRFAEQLRIVRGLLRSVAEVPAFGDRDKLSPHARARIRDRLREARRKNPDFPA